MIIPVSDAQKRLKYVLLSSFHSKAFIERIR